MNTIVVFAIVLEFPDISFGTVRCTSLVIFLLFVFWLAIVWFNLMNGLAIDHAEEIRKNGETLSPVERVRLISEIERVVKALRS